MGFYLNKESLNMPLPSYPPMACGPLKKPVDTLRKPDAARFKKMVGPYLGGLVVAWGISFKSSVMRSKKQACFTVLKHHGKINHSQVEKILSDCGGEYLTFSKFQLFERLALF